MAGWRLLLWAASLLCLWAAGGSASPLECGQCAREFKGLECPDIFDPERIKVTVGDHKDYPESVLTIVCRVSSQKFNISLIKDCDFSLIRYVQFYKCPLLNVSFSEMFNEIGINPENITSLYFHNVGTRQSILEEWHLEGLSNLKNLDFFDNDFTVIPLNLLEAIPRLEYLRLTLNNLATLPESLFYNNQNITEIYLWQNEIESLPDDIFANLSKMTNLSLEKNKLVEFQPELISGTPQLMSLVLSGNKISQLQQDIFSNLVNLTRILLDNNALESLPEDLFLSCTNLEEVKFKDNKIRSLPAGLFRNSNKIKEIDFSHNQITSLPENLFDGMRDLIKLKLQRNGLKTLPSALFSDLVNLEVLDIQSNVLEVLPAGCFDNQRKMDWLGLRNNSLTELPDQIFKNCEYLEKLYLGYNNISKLQSTAFPHPKTVLQLLEMDTNSLSFSSITTNLSQDSEHIVVREQIPLDGQVNLTYLDLSNNKIKAVPLGLSTYFPHLKTLKLDGNNIDYVDSIDLSFKSDNIDVYLRKNQIRVISLQDIEFILAKKIVNLSLQGNPLVCDCHLHDFARFLQGKYIAQSENVYQLNVKDREQLKCSYSEDQDAVFSVMEVNANSLTCKHHDCPAHCTCLTQPYEDMFIIDCANRGLPALPKMKKYFLPNENYSLTLNVSNNKIRSLDGLQNPGYSSLVSLIIPNNKISFVNESEVSDKLQYLDIRSNNISALHKSFLIFLNSSNVTLSLRNNPWLCDCHLLDLYHFLRDSPSKVKDSSSILCSHLGERLIDVSEKDLCPFIEQPLVIATISSITIVLFIFFVLGTVSIYKYQQDIKVWLFKHRLCLWAVAEEEHDSNKKYDAFISYADKDEVFVNSKLVPGLESGDPKYRICLHYRDWIPGEYIHNQIDQSIEASRRTIVILSSNFIQSVWGQMEFKTAHSKALKDKYNRIIIIILGELPPEAELDEELKLYLSTRTYLQWGDPKFWDKLRYAMPHPQEFVYKKQTKNKETEMSELPKENGVINTGADIKQ